MEKDKASTPNKGKDIHVGSDSDFEMESDSDIEMATEARASNMEEHKIIRPPPAPAPYVSDIEMATNIVEKLDNELGSLQPREVSTQNHMDHCIYRVPQRLRGLNSTAYTPLLISIGPIHRRYINLAMGREKLRYFEKLSERMDKKKKCDIVISIKNQEERLRYCYSEKFKKIESSDFVEMILLDAVFIIQFFLESNDDTGPKHFEPRMTFDIREDLMLLENQLPLFIIEKIYDQVSYHSSDNKHKSFLDLATCYLREYLHLQGVETSPDVEKETSLGVKRSRHFTDLLRNLMLCKTSPGVEKETSAGVKKETSPDVETGTSSDVKKEPSHLTDLLRNLMLSRAIPRSYSPDLVKLKYSAIMLHKAGVRFQATQDECLVNITFDKGVLKIPHLKVDHNFESRVRNVMAMEECLYEGEAYICSYIKFMDQLIDSAGDVGLLVENGIILHWLGDDAEVSKMINNLCKNIGDKYTCFDDISKKLNDHYENPWNHRKASCIFPLKVVYFPNVWRGTATVAAAILLILTFIQAVCSVISLF